VTRILYAIAPMMLALAALGADPGSPLDVSAIVSRSIAVNETDWTSDPLYDRCEREDDGQGVQTHDVMMIRGRPYERLVAVADHPLSSSQARDEQDRQQREIARRASEEAAGGAALESRYQRHHARFRALFEQFPNAFTFALGGRVRIGGRMAYHVIATPRAGYEPPTRDARALTAMTVDLWVDIDTYHWIKLVARVTERVPLVGLLVRLEPGTTVELEKAPMDDGDIWLVSRLRFASSARVLMFFGHHTSSDDRYFGFRRSSAHIESSCQETPPNN
jgi:hypothetical protein